MNEKLKVFLQLIAALLIGVALTMNTDYGNDLLEHGVATFEAERNK